MGHPPWTEYRAANAFPLQIIRHPIQAPIKTGRAIQLLKRGRPSFGGERTRLATICRASERRERAGHGTSGPEGVRALTKLLAPLHTRYTKQDA